MRTLDTPNHAFLFHPYVFSCIGDEPGLKEMIGFRKGGCTNFCIQCTFKNGDGIYDPVKHLHRDFQVIKELAIKAEMSLARRTGPRENVKVFSSKVRIAEATKQDSAYNELMGLGIFPMQNCFHYAPMGYKLVES